MENTLFDTQEFKDVYNAAEEVFKEEYPNLTSEANAFYIAFRLGYKYGHAQGKFDERHENERIERLAMGIEQPTEHLNDK